MKKFEKTSLKKGSLKNLIKQKKNANKNQKKGKLKEEIKKFKITKC